MRTQKGISELEQQIDSLLYQRETILYLGDVMAMKLLDQDRLKHFAVHPSPGFISGKAGLKAEIEAAKRFFYDGYMVLFNDLTHSLRIGDLTLAKGDEVRTFEVKANPKEYRTKEAFRQIATPIVIHEYIKNDVTPVPVRIADETLIDADFGTDRNAGYAIRLDSDIVEDVQSHIASVIFKGVWKTPVVEVERGGKRYLACARHNAGALRARLEELTADGQWIVSNIRNRVTENGDAPPFGLDFKPQSTVDLMTGDTIVVAAFSMEELTRQLREKKITLTWKGNGRDSFPMDFKPEFEVQSDLDLQTKNICQWHFERVLYSFLGLETYVERVYETLSPEGVARFAAKIKELEEKKKLKRNEKTQSFKKSEKT